MDTPLEGPLSQCGMSRGLAQLAQLVSGGLPWRWMFAAKDLVSSRAQRGTLCDQRSLAALGMTLFSQLRQCEASAGIRHNIAQFCQEPSVIGGQNNTFVPAWGARERRMSVARHEWGHARRR